MKQLTLMMALCLLGQAPLLAQDVAPINIGVPVEGEIGPDIRQTYSIGLVADRFVTGIANQVSADVIVTVFGPDGAELARFDETARGADWFEFRTTTAGDYRIEIAPFEGAEGSYALLVEEAEPVATSPEAVVDQFMRRFAGEDTPGVVVGVVREGRLIHSRAYGMASLEWGIPMTTETAFNIASVSKQFTAFAIALLEAQGLVSVDEEIHTYLPELPDFGYPITVRHMLTHTSGLRSLHMLLQPAGWRDDDRRTNADLRRLLMRQRSLNFEPGAEYLYSNTGFILAAEIVERVTGEDFESWMAANVFEPVGMTRTSVEGDYDRVLYRTAASYELRQEGGYRPSVPFWAYYGSGNIVTTVGDLAKWMHNLTTGEYGGPEVVARLQERGVLLNGDTLPYALGIGVTQHRGLKILTHSGDIGGYRSRMIHYPELDAGVVLLSNNVSFGPDVAPSEVGAPTYDIAAAFFGDAMAPVVAQAAGAPEAPAPQPERWEPSADELLSVTGRYYSEELDATYTLYVADGRLVAWHPRHGEIDLTPETRPGAFGSAVGFFETVVFGTSAEGAPGFHLSNNRARHMWFQKMQSQ